MRLHLMRSAEHLSSDEATYRDPDGVELEYCSCNLCGADDAELMFVARDEEFGRAGHFRLARCRVCGLVYLNPRPARSSISRFYPEGVYYTHVDPGPGGIRYKLKAFVREYPLQSCDGARGDALRSRRPKIASELAFKALEPYVDLVIPAARNRRVLDVGCGNGANLGWLSLRGWEVHGVDVDPRACELARKRGIRAFRGEIAEARFASGYFDIVVVNHVLEHVHNPVATLRECRRVLADGGSLIVGVPNFACFDRRLFGPAWSALAAPRHLYHFTPETLELVLRKAGFAVDRWKFKPPLPLLDRASLFYLLRDEGMWMGRRAKELLRATAGAWIVKPLLCLRSRGRGRGFSWSMAAYCRKDSREMAGRNGASPGLSIAFVGAEGVPYPRAFARYTEALGSRLAARGHNVTVYCRRRLVSHESDYRGMRRVAMPSLNTKHFDTLTNTFFSMVHAVRKTKPDLVVIHGIGPAIWALVARLHGVRSLVIFHAQDWRNPKWGRLARACLRLGEIFAIALPDATAVVSEQLSRHSGARRGKRIAVIRSGAEGERVASTAQIEKLGLKPQSYVLYLGRLVPSKGCHHLAEAFSGLSTDKRLVFAGAGDRSDEYASLLKSMTDGDAVFLGAVDGSLRDELLSHAYAVVQPSELEGLSLVLIEAMRFGNCLVASDVPGNIEALGGAGILFKTGSAASLRWALQKAIDEPAVARTLGRKARRRALQHFDWDRIADRFESFCRELVDRQNLNGVQHVNGDGLGFGLEFDHRSQAEDPAGRQEAA